MKAGEKYKCIKGLTLLYPFIDIPQYTKGEIYTVKVTRGGKPYIIDDSGGEVFGIREGHFELIK